MTSRGWNRIFSLIDSKGLTGDIKETMSDFQIQQQPHSSGIAPTTGICSFPSRFLSLSATCDKQISAHSSNSDLSTTNTERNEKELVKQALLLEIQNIIFFFTM